MTASQTRFYGRHTELDPVRRSYVVGEDAARGVARMAGESGRVSVDIETMGLNEDAFKVKVAIVANGAQSFVLDATNPRHCAAVTDALDNATELDFHKSAFDVPPLVTAGLMRLEHIDKVFDTLVCARMALTGTFDKFGRVKHGLDALEKRYLTDRFTSTSKDGFADWAKTNGLSKSEAFKKAGYSHPVYLMYAGWDGIVTWLVKDYVVAAAMEQLTDHPFERYGADEATARYLIEREQRVNRIMLRRSARGLALDADRLESQQELLRSRMLELGDALTAHGIADSSNRNQLAKVLEEADAFPEDYPLTKTGKYSTAKGILDAVDHPAVRAFREYDQKRRLFTYMEHARLVAAYTDGRIHPEVNVVGARTGRMSYGNPELHQFVADARTIIRADEGSAGLVSIDWSAIEPVTAANLAGDHGPIEQFEQGGEKFYKVVQDAAGVSYKTAKVVLLAALYGQQLRSLAANLSGALEREVELDEAKDLQAQVLAPLPMTRKFVGWSAAWSEEVGKTWTVSGRIIDVDKEAGYRGTNYCLAPDTPILRSDLSHVPASKIAVGDRLVAFDEHPAAEGRGSNRYRRMRTAVVEKVSTIVKRSLTVRTADGKATVCSADHLWLVRPKRLRKNVSRNLWIRADELQPGDALLSLGTWEVADGRTAGYLAGLYDGEGNLRCRIEGGQKAALGFSQLPGPVMDRFRAGMEELGLRYWYGARSPNNTSPTDSAMVSGVRHVLRALGTLQPVRFQSRFEQIYEGAAITGGLTESVVVEAVEPAGELELASIQTSTRTLVANGYLSHNCVQGSAYDVLSETICGIDEAGLADAIYLTMHDEVVCDVDAAHDVRKIMETPPERLCELAGRAVKLRTDAAFLGEHWDDADRHPSWPLERAA